MSLAHDHAEKENQFADFDSFEHVAVVLGEFVVINAAFSFATDVVAQKLEGKWICSPPETSVGDLPEGTVVEVPPKIDMTRSVRFACTGVFFCGVVQFIRLAVIDVIFDRNDLTIATALVKTGFNQLVFSPIVRAWSMVTLVMLDKENGGTWELAILKLRTSFCEAQGVSYMVKPVSNFFAFVLFPNHILGQAVVMRTVAFAYNVYFSYTVHKEMEGGKNIKNEDVECEILEEDDDEEDIPLKKPPISDAKSQRTNCLCAQCSVM